MCVTLEHCICGGPRSAIREVWHSSVEEQRTGRPSARPLSTKTVWLLTPRALVGGAMARAVDPTASTPGYPATSTITYYIIGYQYVHYYIANDMDFAGCFQPPVICAYLTSRALDSFLCNTSHYKNGLS